MGMMLRMVGLAGVTVAVVAIGYVVLVVVAAIVLLWLMLDGERAILGD